MKPLVTTIATTAVSKECIYVDGKLLAEMTDGSLLQFRLDRSPKERELNGWYNGFLYLTKDELVKKVGEINTAHMLDCNHALHLEKVQRLGWDYRQRGYY